MGTCISGNNITNRARVLLVLIIGVNIFIIWFCFIYIYIYIFLYYILSANYVCRPGFCCSRLIGLVDAVSPVLRLVINPSGYDFNVFFSSQSSCSVVVLSVRSAHTRSPAAAVTIIRARRTFMYFQARPAHK